MMTNIDLFRTGVGHRVLRELQSTSVVLKDRKTRYSLMKRKTYLKNNNSFNASPRATYSASDVERVTHFCVLENQHTYASPHMFALSDTQSS